MVARLRLPVHPLKRGSVMSYKKEPMESPKPGLASIEAQMEEWLRAHAQDVVHALVDHVVAQAAVAAQQRADLDLGADAIGAGDEDGIPVALAQLEQTGDSRP